MFLKLEKRTFIGEIQYRSKKKETSSPGVGTHEKFAWEKKMRKIPGNHNISQPRISPIEEYATIHGEIPGPPDKKIKPMSLDKQKAKPRYTIIEKNIKRWQPGKGSEKSPDPATYHVAEAIEAAQWPKKKDYGFSKRDRVSVFKEIQDKAFQKENKGTNAIPGVGNYFKKDKALDKALDLTSRTSPLNKARRH